MESVTRIFRSRSAMSFSSFAILLCLCFVIGLAYGKECTNVPTERASHTHRSREIAHEEYRAPEISGGTSSVELPKTTLIDAFRKSFTGNGGRNFVDEDLTDDVLVDIDDWEQAWRKMAKPMLDKIARRADHAVAGEIDGNHLESSKEVVSRSEPVVAGLLKDVSLHKVNKR